MLSLYVRTQGAYTNPYETYLKQLSILAYTLLDTIHDLGEEMDKKMHQVTKRMKTAEKDIKSGKPKEATKVLHKAEKKNEKLVKIDKNVRDPLIKKCKQNMKNANKNK